jgi:choline monooxygenase
MDRFFVEKNIARASTIHRDFYTDPAIFELSREKIFGCSWQFAGDTDRLKNYGDAYPLTLLENFLDEPLLISKDHEGKIHCMSNVCTHRGNLLLTEACNVHNIRCKYHGRLFNLDGKFRSMPEFAEVENFPTEADNLKQLELYQWGKWLFTSLGSKFAAEDFFREMRERISWMPLDEFVFRPDLSQDFMVDAHWALYCENYLEGFHIPFVHAGLNAIIDYGNYTTELFRYSSLQLGIGKHPEISFDIPASSVDHGKHVAAYYFWVFPNMMFNFYPWGLSINIALPVSTGKTRVTFLTYMWDESKKQVGAGGKLEDVEHEDEEIVQNVQKGIRSRFYQHGRYSVNREQGTHHFHRLLYEFIK